LASIRQAFSVSCVPSSQAIVLVVVVTNRERERERERDLLQEALVKFDDHFQNMVAEILRVPCLSDDHWDLASLPVKLSGLGVNQTKVIAGSAYVGSCALTKSLVAALLGREAAFEPDGVVDLLSAHEADTGTLHTLSSLASEKSVQHKLSSERHKALFERLKAKASIRSQNLMLSCTMPHASDWLLAPPIPGLGLSLQSDVFRTALGIPLFSEPFPCPALSSSEGKACASEMDIFGDHAPCCHHGPSLVFRHNNVRDILGHSARAAGLAAVVSEKKNQTIVALRRQHLTLPSLIHCSKNIKILRWRRRVW